MFRYNGRKLSVKGTITLEAGTTIRDVVYADGWKVVCIATGVSWLRWGKEEN